MIHDVGWRMSTWIEIHGLIKINRITATLRAPAAHGLSSMDSNLKFKIDRYITHSRQRTLNKSNVNRL